MAIAFGVEQLRKALSAVGLDPSQPYSRVVLEFTVGHPAKVYATKYATCEDVLRVVETLDGAKVEAKDDDTVEIVTLTEAKK